jgi:hypothetical protein
MIDNLFATITIFFLTGAFCLLLGAAGLILWKFWQGARAKRRSNDP